MIHSDRILQESFVRHVEHHDTLPSTNALAMELLQPLLDAGPSLVITDRQTSGRGRGTNQWWSSEGALTFSLVLDTASIELPADQHPLVSLCAGLVVRDCVASLVETVTAQIKWPNDVLVGGRKVAGILLEMQKTPDGRTGIVVGIGVNVNNSMAAAPDDLRQNATSLFDLSGDSFDLTEVLLHFLAHWTTRLRQLQTDLTESCAEWNRWNALNGCIVTIRSVDSSHTGRCSEIDPRGRLVLESDSGQRRFTSGIIESWRR